PLNSACHLIEEDFSIETPLAHSIKYLMMHLMVKNEPNTLLPTCLFLFHKGQRTNENTQRFFKFRPQLPRTKGTEEEPKKAPLFQDRHGEISNIAPQSLNFK
ncbi:MAG: hypothetical protein ACKOW3_04275, partial [Hyphomicrobium sp.]